MITHHDIDNAQQAWGEGIVAIAKAHSEGGDYEGVARNHVETLYAYGMGDVLFKPTLAAVEQFRPTFDEALSYFVASNNACPRTRASPSRDGQVSDLKTQASSRETTALAMGNYFFTTPEGDEVKVEYTFGYMLDEVGALRINVHHSSMPATV